MLVDSYCLAAQDMKFLDTEQLTVYLNNTIDTFTVNIYEIILHSSGHSVASTVQAF